MLVPLDTDLWSHEFTLAWQRGLVPIPVRMTVIRLRDGRLVLHSPAPLDANLGAELDALGEVAFIVVPDAHGKFAAAAAAAYPRAQALKDVFPAEWRGELETFAVRGFRLREVVLFHAPTRTLVITDLCFNIRESPRAFARFFFRANGMWRRFGPSRIIRALAVSDGAALRESLDVIARWDFARIVPGHGEVIENAPRSVLHEAWFGAR